MAVPVTLLMKREQIFYSSQIRCQRSDADSTTGAVVTMPTRSAYKSRQAHTPGRLGLSDFTDVAGFGVTMPDSLSITGSTIPASLIPASSMPMSYWAARASSP